MPTPRLIVFYGRAPKFSAQMDALKASLGTGRFVCEPGNFKTAPTANSYAYFSATGVNAANVSLKPLYTSLQSAGHLLGFEDPAGPGTPMVDLRKPEARKAMIDFLIANFVTKGNFAGVMLDAIASAEAVEYKCPGLKTAATVFVKELALKLHAMPGKTLIVNGLFQDNVMQKEIAKHADFVMCESQCSLSGTKRTASDNAWTIAKLALIAKGAAAAKRKVGILFVEPDAGDKATKVKTDAELVIPKLIKEANKAAAVTDAITASGLYVCTQPHFQTLEL